MNLKKMQILVYLIRDAIYLQLGHLASAALILTILFFSLPIIEILCPMRQ